MKQAILVLCLFTAISAFGQMPKTLNYQGTLATGSTPVPDGEYKLTFRLYPDSSGGTPVWLEGQKVTTRNGVFNAILGKITTLPVTFNTAYWMSLQVGDDPELSPRLEMTGVSYSMHAAVADSAAKVTNNSVNTAALAYAAVTSDKIRDEAIIGQKILPNTITSAHIVDEPGVSHSIGTVFSLNAGNIDYLVDSVEITLPGPGYIFIIATGFVTISHVVGTISHVDIGLERTPLMQSASQSAIIIPISLATQIFAFPFTATRVLDENSLGAKKYYLFARYTSGSSPSTSITASFFTAIYFPTLSGTLY